MEDNAGGLGEVAGAGGGNPPGAGQLVLAHNQAGERGFTIDDVDEYIVTNHNWEGLELLANTVAGGDAVKHPLLLLYCRKVKCCHLISNDLLEEASTLFHGQIVPLKSIESAYSNQELVNIECADLQRLLNRDRSQLPDELVMSPNVLIKDYLLLYLRKEIKYDDGRRTISQGKPLWPFAVRIDGEAKRSRVNFRCLVCSRKSFQSSSIKFLGNHLRNECTGVRGRTTPMLNRMLQEAQIRPQQTTRDDGASSSKRKRQDPQGSVADLIRAVYRDMEAGMNESTIEGAKASITRATQSVTDVFHKLCPDDLQEATAAQHIIHSTGPPSVAASVSQFSLALSVPPADVLAPVGDLLLGDSAAGPSQQPPPATIDLSAGDDLDANLAFLDDSASTPPWLR